VALARAAGWPEPLGRGALRGKPVLYGAVDMHYRQEGQERVERLAPGCIRHADPGDEHVAHPAPAARILVIERKGSA
jgi:hypothetical protein